MKLNELEQCLSKMESIEFILPNNLAVPSHFHITEVGKVERHFVDCGGVERKETKINLQLWVATDYEHRLKPSKLLGILEMSKQKLGLNNEEVEVEFQSSTIGKYDLEFNGHHFRLINTFTQCLAMDQCGVPAQKQKISLKSLNETGASQCTPGGGCC